MVSYLLRNCMSVCARQLFSPVHDCVGMGTLFEERESQNVQRTRKGGTKDRGEPHRRHYTTGHKVAAQIRRTGRRRHHVIPRPETIPLHLSLSESQ